MDDVRIVPANEVSWEDLQAVVIGKRDRRLCGCQWLKTPSSEWGAYPEQARMAALREQSGCGDDAAEETTGLVAFVGGEPAGWVAVEPRARFRQLARTRIPWSGREEDKDDERVWVVPCVLVRREFRGRHLTYELVAATIDFARSAGASALEAYPMVTEPGKEIIWDELHLGPLGAFEAAGFEIVSAPTKRRRVVRIDF